MSYELFFILLLFNQILIDCNHIIDIGAFLQRFIHHIIQILYCILNKSKFLCLKIINLLFLTVVLFSLCSLKGVIMVSIIVSTSPSTIVVPSVIGSSVIVGSPCIVVAVSEVVFSLHNKSFLSRRH